MFLNIFFIILIFNMVCNCRAEISPRPVSQDVHLCTTFYLYRLNYVAHALQILCFCQQLVCFWGDKSRTDDKQPISVSVDSVRLDTLQIVIAHTIDSRVTSPTGQFQTGRIWIMIYPSVISLDNCTATALTLSTCLISFGIVVALCSLATLDGISRPPFCITTDLFAE